MATHDVPKPFCRGPQCQAMGIMISPAQAVQDFSFMKKKKQLNKINLFVAGFYFHQIFTGFCWRKKQARGSFHPSSDGCSSAIPQPLPQHLTFQSQSSCCSSTQNHLNPLKVPTQGGPGAQGSATTPAPIPRAFQEHGGAFKPKRRFCQEFLHCFIWERAQLGGGLFAVNADCSLLFFSFIF